jgi:hypothetical protein
MDGGLKPPFQHPEWQGSVPSKWMDRGTGYIRGKPQLHADIKEGLNGVARKGLGAFSDDAGGRMYEEGLQRTKQYGAPHGVAPWGDHPMEFKWKPSKRKLEDHEFNWRVGPGTGHGGLLAHVSEPDLLSKRPPFVEQGKEIKPLNKFVPPSFIGEHRLEELMKRGLQEVARTKPVDPHEFLAGFISSHGRIQKQTRPRFDTTPNIPSALPALTPKPPKSKLDALPAKVRTAILDDRFWRTQVLNLEDWERSHTRGAIPEASATMPAYATATMANRGKAGNDITRLAKPSHSQSESQLSFNRSMR